MLLLMSTIFVWKMKPRPAGPSRAMALAIILLIVQSLLGGIVVFTSLEPVITTIHLAFATAFFTTIIFGCALMHSSEKSSLHKSEVLEVTDTLRDFGKRGDS
jgi:heme A synthase